MSVVFLAGKTSANRLINKCNFGRDLAICKGFEHKNLGARHWKQKVMATSKNPVNNLFWWKKMTGGEKSGFHFFRNLHNICSIWKLFHFRANIPFFWLSEYRTNTSCVELPHTLTPTLYGVIVVLL